MRCDLHDYIEIVCLYNYPIKLILTSGEIILGNAIDTQYNSNREECIKIESDNTQQLIKLNNLKALVVCIDNPHFKEMIFD